MFLRHTVDYTPGPTEQHTWATQARRHRGPAGPAAKYHLEWFHHNKSDTRLERGDVLIFVTADNEWIYPPAVVDSEAIAILHARGAVGHLLRSRADLSPIPVPEAEQTLADLGHPNPRLLADHRIASPCLRTALLQLWNL